MNKYLKRLEIKFLLLLSIVIFTFLALLSFLHLHALFKRANARGKIPSKIEVSPSLPAVKGLRSQTIIEGSLSFPSNKIPEELIICAQNLETNKIYCTQQHQSSPKYLYGIGYQLIIAPGIYHVYSYLENPQFPTEYQGYKAYYTQAVPCGLTIECTDHQPLPVTVSQGQRLKDIHPIDWYNF